MVWTSSLEGLDAFINYLNDIQPPLSSLAIASFLDVNLSIINGKIITDLYTKATEIHRYLLHSSCHPTHTKRAIPLSLALRFRRIFFMRLQFVLWIWFFVNTTFKTETAG